MIRQSLRGYPGAIITRDGEETVKRKEGLKAIKKTRAKVLRNDTDRALHLLGLPSAQTVGFKLWGFPRNAN
jgi:hypothetical protein